jgi:hypothetical protein
MGAAHLDIPPLGEDTTGIGLAGLPIVSFKVVPHDTNSLV